MVSTITIDLSKATVRQNRHRSNMRSRKFVYSGVKYHTNETSVKAHKHYLLRHVTNTNDDLRLGSVKDASLGGHSAKRR